MPPLLVALAAGVGLYAGGLALKRELRRVRAVLKQGDSAPPRLMGTLERDPKSGVYRAPQGERPRDE